MTYYVDNILDLLKKYDNETISKLLGQFVCHKNEEIDTFIRKKALPFAKQGLSITYLVYSDADELVGIFTLANKTLTVETENISSSLQKKLEKFGKYDAAGTRITVPGANREK